MCTLTFLREVLKGQKKLLMISATTAIPDIPRIREINAAVIWADIKGDETIGFCFYIARYEENFDFKSFETQY